MHVQSSFTHALCSGGIITKYNASAIINTIQETHTLVGVNIREMAQTANGTITDQRRFAFCDGQVIGDFHLSASETARQKKLHNGKVPLPAYSATQLSRPGTFYNTTTFFLDYTGHGPINTTTAAEIFEGPWPGDATLVCKQSIDFSKPTDAEIYAAEIVQIYRTPTVILESRLLPKPKFPATTTTRRVSTTYRRN